MFHGLRGRVRLVGQRFLTCDQGLHDVVRIAARTGQSWRALPVPLKQTSRTQVRLYSRLGGILLIRARPHKGHQYSQRVPTRRLRRYTQRDSSGAMLSVLSTSDWAVWQLGLGGADDCSR